MCASARTRSGCCSRPTWAASWRSPSRGPTNSSRTGPARVPPRRLGPAPPHLQRLRERHAGVGARQRRARAGVAGVGPARRGERLGPVRRAAVAYLRRLMMTVRLRSPDWDNKNHDAVSLLGTPLFFVSLLNKKDVCYVQKGRIKKGRACVDSIIHCQLKLRFSGVRSVPVIVG